MYQSYLGWATRKADKTELRCMRGEKKKIDVDAQSELAASQPCDLAASQPRSILLPCQTSSPITIHKPGGSFYCFEFAALWLFF